MVKKLAFISLCAFGIPFVTQTYDVDALQTELQSIEKYIQVLHQENASKSTKLATWLQNKINDTSKTTDDDIMIMASMANKNESQIASLSKKVGYIAAYLFAATIGAISAFYWHYRYIQEHRNSGWL